MQIEVFRDACCAADDQLGPLVKKLNLDGRAPLRQLVESIVASGFLQYSSTHSTLLGYADGVAVVRVHSSEYTRENTQYLIDPETEIREVIKTGSIDFRF